MLFNNSISTEKNLYSTTYGVKAHGGALRYKLEGHGFLMVSLEFFIDIILPAAL